MANKAFVFGVLLLWTGSMSWLVVKKLAPSTYDREAPAVSGFGINEPVAWRVEWSGRPAGSAVSVRTAGVSGTSQLHNRIVLADIPLLDLAPTWMRSIVGEIGPLSFDASTLLEFDSLDSFSALRCSIGVNGIPSVLTVRGRLEDSQLKLTVRSGQLSYHRTPELRVADHAMLGEALFPDAKMPYMYVGRAWTEETFNPFLSPNSPIELIEAEVVAIERIYDGEKSLRVMRVEFKSPASPGIPEDARLQAVAWVIPDDGTVVRQDLYIAGTQLRFNRMSPEDARREAKSLLDDLMLDETPDREESEIFARPAA